MATPRGETVPANAGDPSEQEIQTRLASVKVAMGLTLVVCLGSAAYALATWSDSNRALILAVIGFGVLSVPFVRALPLERIVRSRHGELFFIGWSVADIVLIGALAGLDGGTHSAYMLLLILPFLFAALTYSPKATVMVGLADLAAAFILGAAVGGGFPLKGFGLFSQFCIALLAGWSARNHLRQRDELSATAKALIRSEASSRLQARQQHEVAQFGQLALEGADTAELAQEACQIVARVLEVEFSALFRLESGGKEVVAVASVGTSEELVGRATTPVTEFSHLGYTLETGMPVVVNDWEVETRFEQSELQRAHGLRSATLILIKGKGKPYGVLGAASQRQYDFSEQDVNFMQAICNVLANAIERRRTEEQTQHEALHDPLTALPNRNLFLDRLQHALSQADRRGTQVAVLFLDLDQFKLVNDSLGHAAGDELLAAVAPRIEHALRPGDTVARFGGDEFAILAEDIANERGATRIAERIAEALTRPFILREREHFVSASIGISIATGPEAPEALIRDADAALYRAKERGRGGYEIFDEVMRSRVIDHMQTENDLRRALQRKELELHYQPVVRFQDGSVVAMEALLRWNHPERGLLAPLAFIPVAEESRLIVPIGRWVIEEACRRAASWQRLRPDRAPVSVSINLSARQVADPGLLTHLEESIRVNMLDPSTVWLELTESTLLEDTVFVERTLAAMERLGVRLVLDDFGVGFSSLGYLKRLPLSMIKLDRSFVENLVDSLQDAAIVHAVSEMADTFGIGVVAEGVETAEQAQMAAKLGCGFAQGFHFKEPVPADQVGDLLSGPIVTESSRR